MQDQPAFQHQDVDPKDVDPRDVVVNLRWLERNGYGSASTIWRKRKARKFPEPDFPDAAQWRLSTIRRYNEARERKR